MVAVVLQPMKQDPPLDARCKDKFLVQSIEVSAGTGVPSVQKPAIMGSMTDAETMQWPEIEKTSKSAVQERKIRVHYLPSSDSQHVADVNGHAQDDDTTVFRSSPAPPAYSPQTQSHLEDSTVLGERSAATPSPGDDREEKTSH